MDSGLARDARPRRATRVTARGLRGKTFFVFPSENTKTPPLPDGPGSMLPDPYTLTRLRILERSRLDPSEYRSAGHPM
jgi:hypothetical protein